MSPQVYVVSANQKVRDQFPRSRERESPMPVLNLAVENILVALNVSSC